MLWRYKRPRPTGAFVLHDTNRGVALYGDKVYFAAGEAVLVALDAKTGTRGLDEDRRRQQVRAITLTLAPLVADGKVMVGASGGEFGVRGFVAAFDPDTGKELWRTFTVPAPGEPGSETWPKGDQWKTGGAPIWVTGNYDPETNLAFWGTGNGGPWMGDQRPGDNLYIASTIALDVATGQIKGHFQYNPNESWDWDEVSPPILVDYPAQRPHDQRSDRRRARRLSLVPRAHAPVRSSLSKASRTSIQNVFRGLDPKTGKPDVDPGAQARNRKAHRVLPGLARRQELAADCVQPEDADDLHSGQQQHVRSAHRHTGDLDGRQELHGHAVGGPPTLSAGRRPRRRSAGVERGHRPARVDATSIEFTPNWGSMLTTAGGLVFSGGTNDRKIHAFDAKTGKLLWESAPAPASSRRRRRSPWTASSTSPCSLAGAATCEA